MREAYLDTEIHILALGKNRKLNNIAPKSSKLFCMFHSMTVKNIQSMNIQNMHFANLRMVSKFT